MALMFFILLKAEEGTLLKIAHELDTNTSLLFQNLDVAFNEGGVFEQFASIEFDLNLAEVAQAQLEKIQLWQDTIYAAQDVFLSWLDDKKPICFPKLPETASKVNYLFNGSRVNDESWVQAAEKHESDCYSDESDVLSHLSALLYNDLFPRVVGAKHRANRYSSVLVQQKDVQIQFPATLQQLSLTRQCLMNQFSEARDLYILFSESHTENKALLEYYQEKVNQQKKPRLQSNSWKYQSNYNSFVASRCGVKRGALRFLAGGKMSFAGQLYPAYQTDAKMIEFFAEQEPRQSIAYTEIVATIQKVEELILNQYQLPSVTEGKTADKADFQPTNIFLFASCIDEISIIGVTEKIKKTKEFSAEFLRHINAKLTFVTTGQKCPMRHIPISVFQKIFGHDIIDLSAPLALSRKAMTTRLLRAEQIDAFGQNAISLCSRAGENVVCNFVPTGQLFNPQIGIQEPKQDMGFMMTRTLQQFIVTRELNIIATSNIPAELQQCSVLCIPEVKEDNFIPLLRQVFLDSQKSQQASFDDALLAHTTPQKLRQTSRFEPTLFQNSQLVLLPFGQHIYILKSIIKESSELLLVPTRSLVTPGYTPAAEFCLNESYYQRQCYNTISIFIGDQSLGINILMPEQSPHIKGTKITDEVRSELRNFIYTEYKGYFDSTGLQKNYETLNHIFGEGYRELYDPFVLVYAATEEVEFQSLSKAYDLLKARGFRFVYVGRVLPAVGILNLFPDNGLATPTIQSILYLGSNLTGDVTRFCVRKLPCEKYLFSGVESLDCAVIYIPWANSRNFNLIVVPADEFYLLHKDPTFQTANYMFSVVIPEQGKSTNEFFQEKSTAKQNWVRRQYFKAGLVECRLHDTGSELAYKQVITQYMQDKLKESSVIVDTAELGIWTNLSSHLLYAVTRNVADTGYIACQQEGSCKLPELNLYDEATQWAKI